MEWAGLGSGSFRVVAEDRLMSNPVLVVVVVEGGVIYVLSRCRDRDGSMCTLAVGGDKAIAALGEYCS